MAYRQNGKIRGKSRIFLLFSSLILTSCFKLNVEPEPAKPNLPIPTHDDGQGGGGDSEPSDTEEDPKDPVDPKTDDYLVLTDLNDKYFVGETLSKISRLNLKVHKDGKDTDISSRTTGYDYKLFNSNKTELDPNKPFPAAGKYTYYVYLTNAPEIVSNKVEIDVLESPSNELIEKNVIKSQFTYNKFEESCAQNLSYPNVGEIDALVIPVEIKDYPFKDAGFGSTYLDRINAAFNGNGSADTNYWESVSSYYEKASRGKLNFNFEIAEVFKTNFSTSTLLNIGIGASVSILDLAVNNYKSNHGSSALRKFDNDGDGYLDGVWLVYSAPNYSTGVYGNAINSDLFWAFCTDSYNNEPDIYSPTGFSFGWASIDFLLKDDDPTLVDTHTFIHETGHLLGLPDYYSYDIDSLSTSGAQGGLAMMDLNIGDQDSFSKMSLGWASPYVPTDDCVIKIKPNESSGDCVVLADNWNGTAFDEYILLDLQTPTGLNKLDSSEQYTENRPLYFNEPGIRMYHIDARLGEFKYDGSNISPVIQDDTNQYYLKDSKVSYLLNKGSLNKIDLDDSIPYEERQSGYTVINANSPSRTLINEAPYTNNRLISIIGANNKNSEVDTTYANNDFLFKKGDSWTLNPRTSRFFNSKEISHFNNDDSFSFTISVLECNNSGATIQIRKHK